MKKPVVVWTTGDIKHPIDGSPGDVVAKKS